MGLAQIEQHLLMAQLVWVFSLLWLIYVIKKGKSVLTIWSVAQIFLLMFSVWLRTYINLK